MIIAFNHGCDFIQTTSIIEGFLEEICEIIVIKVGGAFSVNLGNQLKKLRSLYQEYTNFVVSLGEESTFIKSPSKTRVNPSMSNRPYTHEVPSSAEASHSQNNR